MKNVSESQTVDGKPSRQDFALEALVDFLTVIPYM